MNCKKRINTILLTLTGCGSCKCGCLIFINNRLLNIADGNMTVCELVDRYLKTKTGVREGNRTGYVTATFSSD